MPKARIVTQEQRMLGICGNADSINVQMVLWCGEQTGIDCQRIAAALQRCTSALSIRLGFAR